MREKKNITEKKQPRHQILHSFNLYPASRFETQSDKEEVILLLRAHPITQLGWISATIILMLFPPFLTGFLVQYLSNAQVIFIVIGWYAIVLSYVFLNILSWLFNVGIVTNERIVDVDFHSVLYKEMTSSSISKIEDVTVRTGGFLASVFHFGNVFVQTAGTEANIEFISIPRPAEVASIINHLMTP